MRLEITRRCDLAIRGLIALAESKTVVPRSELSDWLGADAGYLARAMRPLVEAGWVESTPGPGGGYLAHTAIDRLSLLDVIEAVEGPTDSGRCVVAGLCGDDGFCALHDAWSAARSTLLAQLDETSVAAAAVQIRTGDRPTKRETTR